MIGGVLWGLLSACSTPQPSVAPAVEGAPGAAPTAPAAAAGPEVVFVAASKLNLREAPGGAKLGSLDINSPLEVVERRGADLHVRVANGKQGWVPAEFTVPERLSAELALDRVRAAAAPADRLAWAQRAAALDTRNRDALKALAAAYREQGNEAVAARLDRQLDWPDDVLLAGTHPSDDPTQVVLQWSYHYERPDDVPEDGPISAAAARRRGLTVGQDVWVLPERSPASRGRLAAVRHDPFNECGGSWGFTLVVDVALPTGERPVAYTIATPPASWVQPAPVADTQAAIARVKASWTPPAGETRYHAAAFDNGVRVRAGTALNPSVAEEGDPVDYQIVDFQVDADGARPLGEPGAWTSYMTYDRPWVGRDLDGDGRADLVFLGSCQTSVMGADGEVHATTESLCCGC